MSLGSLRCSCSEQWYIEEEHSRGLRSCRPLIEARMMKQRKQLKILIVFVTGNSLKLSVK